MPDITALGAAMAAGHAEGIDVWELEGEEIERVPSDTFLPTTTPEGKILSNLMTSIFYLLRNVFLLFIERDARYTKWKMAVERSLGWAAVKRSDQMTGKFYNIEQVRSEISGTFKAMFLTFRRNLIRY